MKKIVFLLFFVCGFMSLYAGPYVVGVNQINDLLGKIEKGTGDTPPSPVSDTGVDSWTPLAAYGITITPEAEYFHPPYLDNSYNYAGFVTIDFANKGYKQKEGTVISLVQPDLNIGDYSGIPDGYSDVSNYLDRNDISYLESIDFSGNDFSNIVIDGNNIMPLKSLNLKGNTNLQHLNIQNCPDLEMVDITGCNQTLPEISDIISSVSDATVNYEYQGEMTFYYGNVDLTDFISRNGGNNTSVSWSVQPESSDNYKYTFPPEMSDKMVTLTLTNPDYQGVSITYNVELSSKEPVKFVLDATLTAIYVENLTNPGQQIFVGDEVLISVYNLGCSALELFTIDGAEITLDQNNRYKMTTTKSIYNLSAISENDNIPRKTTNYLRNGSFEYGLDLDWEYAANDGSNANFSLSSEKKIYDGGTVGLRVDVNSLKSSNSVFARTHVTVGCDSLYLLQFWAHGPEEAQLYVTIEGSEQKGILYKMREGNKDSDGQMVAFHYPFKIDKSNYNKELTITFYFQSDVTINKSNDPNNCHITYSQGVTYYLDGLVLVDQMNDMQHDVYNTYSKNYNQVANSEGKMWIAGDNDVSFDLPDGRRMWFFNDSFYGKSYPDYNELVDVGTFVRNAVVIQDVDGSLRTLPPTNQGGQWTYFRIPDADVIYNTAGDPSSGVSNIFWVGDALMEDNQVKVYLIEVWSDGSGHRSYIGKFSYPDLNFLGIEEQEPFCRTYEKFLVDNGMIYLYASGGSGWTRTMKVARAELGDMNGKKGTWRFWDGTTWNPDNTKAVEVSQRGADDIKKLGEGNYVQIAMPVMSPEVYALFAPSPEGPWGNEKLIGTGDQSANFWYYMPNLHGQLANGKYSISMSANYDGCLFFCKDCENQLFVDKYWYRPRYIQADLLALSPYTTNKKDCAGVENGSAYWDKCSECVGGTTGLEPCLTGVAKLYADAGYAGKAIGLNVGEYTSSDLIGLGFDPKSLSSFMLDEGYVIELYPDDNFQGNMKLFEGGVESLEAVSLGNQVSSLIVRRKGLENLEGIYAIQNKQSELYMNPEGDQTANNTLVVQEAYSGKNPQKFELNYLGGGYYAIINIGGEKALNIVDQSTAAKSFVELWDGKEVDITLYKGEISAQYYDSPTAEGISNLIDKNVNTKYLTFHNKGWVQFSASAPYVLSRYSITSANDNPVRDPRDWTLSGSNDGSNWTILDTQTGISFGSRFQEKSFILNNNTTAYSYYRLEMTCATGTTLQLSEWKLYAQINNPEGEYFDSQKFVIQDAGNGFVRIINKASDMILEILDGYTDEGVEVWQNDDYGQQGGLWKLVGPLTIDNISGVNTNNSIIVYPNPVSEFVKIETKESETIKRILLVDLSGKTILDNIYEEDQVTVSLSDLSKGIYLLKVYTDNGPYIQKIIKL